jgi:formate dehydrogenase subunit delta
MSTPEPAAPARLIHMANQIGMFFKAQDPADAPGRIAEHLRKFWDPRMRRAIVAHLDAGGAGLDPPVRQAVDLLRP